MRFPSSLFNEQPTREYRRKVRRAYDHFRIMKKRRKGKDGEWHLSLSVRSDGAMFYLALRALEMEGLTRNPNNTQP